MNIFIRCLDFQVIDVLYQNSTDPWYQIAMMPRNIIEAPSGLTVIIQHTIMDWCI